MQMYTAPLQLKMFDDAGEKMTVDTDQWEKIWAKMAQMQKENVFPEMMDPQKQMNRQYDQNNPFAYDDFMSGRLAMAIINYGQIQQLTNANKNAANFKGLYTNRMGCRNDSFPPGSKRCWRIHLYEWYYGYKCQSAKP